MKYNLTNIMNKAWSLKRLYGMDMSTALTKAWKLAKLNILNNELDNLNSKDISGGKTTYSHKSKSARTEKQSQSWKAKSAFLKRRYFRL